MPRKASIEGAIMRLTPDQFTRDGFPKLGAINALLDKQFKRCTTAERDKLWKARVASAEGAGPIAADIEIIEIEGDASAPEPVPDRVPVPVPDGLVAVTVTEASADPVTVYVHGKGGFKLRIGESQRVPPEAVEALRNSDCKFTQE